MFVNETALLPTPTTNTSSGSAFGPNVNRVVNAVKGQYNKRLQR